VLPDFGLGPQSVPQPVPGSFARIASPASLVRETVSHVRTASDRAARAPSYVTLGLVAKRLGRCALGWLALMADDSRVDEISSAGLSRTECLVLLGTTEFGHLTLTRRALPLVVPAHYVLDGDHVLIHASTGGNPDLWRNGEIVALHVDAFDADQRAGWSVSVTGAAREVANLVGTGTISRAPWLPAGGGNVIAVSTDLVWGQRFGSARDSNRDH
jgi:hypothetical protein